MRVWMPVSGIYRGSTQSVGWTVPESGMFIWLRIYWRVLSSSDYHHIGSEEDIKASLRRLETRLVEKGHQEW
ncbi:hypothetical protein BJY04DRAFT_174817 [Aspergillus karnatakaensis]|uniref:uncharacterized protein n=1 Tax=Aspergillus karnatakaensis TaxID=1810916 RepID=UPI003CCCC292